MTIASRAWSSSAGNKVLLWLIQAILTLLLMIAFSLFPPHFLFSWYYPFQIPSSPSHQRTRKKTLYISLSISCSFSWPHSTTPPHTHPPTFHTILSPNWKIAEQYFTHRAACDYLPANNGNIPAVDLLLGYAWNTAGRPAGCITTRLCLSSAETQSDKNQFHGLWIGPLHSSSSYHAQIMMTSSFRLKRIKEKCTPDRILVLCTEPDCKL